VKAARFFTSDTDGLKQKWGKRVWMNPPYGQPLIAQFSEAMAARVESGEVATAIVLVNNATETEWFQRLLDVASAICFVRGRIRFLDESGQPVNAPLQGQIALYMGNSVGKFADTFAEFGHVIKG
jgi:phage N-6-adenine-methyltransferase